MTNHTLQRQLFKTGASLAGLSVILGAFGAHYIKDQVTVNMMQAFETGVRYQFYHALGILFMASFLRKLHEKTAVVVFRAFIAGIVLFSGSLYVLSTSQIWAGVAFSWIGAITPLGGLGFIFGWSWLVSKGYKVPDGNGHRHTSSHFETHTHHTQS